MSNAIRIIGLDPGLRHMGWGVIESVGTRLVPIASGTVRPPTRGTMANRLAVLYDGLIDVLMAQEPLEAAVEETFVNRDPAGALKLGQARGVALLAPARYGIPVAEYAANKIKKTVVGVGHADKVQVQAMINVLLPTAKPESADAADALAIAICHAQHRVSAARLVS
ncbi:MAG: crossover junction endodeoxyribonuclease RuvC [Pseudomonadota bacterium]